MMMRLFGAMVIKDWVIREACYGCLARLQGLVLCEWEKR